MKKTTLSTTMAMEVLLSRVIMTKAKRLVHLLNTLNRAVLMLDSMTKREPASQATNKNKNKNRRNNTKRNDKKKKRKSEWLLSCNNFQSLLWRLQRDHIAGCPRWEPKYRASSSR